MSTLPWQGRTAFVTGGSGFIGSALAQRLAGAYGTYAARVIGPATSLSDLGEHFGSGLYEAEVRYLMTHEWAQSPDDVLWRRTKLAMSIDEAGRAALTAFMARV